MFFLLSSVANFHNINENKFSFHLLYQNFALSLQMDMLMKQVKCRVGKIRYHGVDWI